MPVYEYECQECGEKFEQFRSISSDDSEVECPKCNTKEPKRVMSAFATCCSDENCSPTGCG